MSLAQQPRIVSLVSITDGNVYDFKDDGVEGTPGSFGDTRPKQARQIIIAALNKKLKDGTPVYYAGRRRPGKQPGEFEFSPDEIRPAFAGDPLVELARPLDTNAIKTIKVNMAKRAEVNRASLAAQGIELANWMQRMAAAANASGASAPRSAPPSGGAGGEGGGNGGSNV
jgi:hypothetical protein